LAEALFLALENVMYPLNNIYPAGQSCVVVFRAPKASKKWINTRRLSKQKKQIIFAGMKKTNPELVDLLRDDNMSELRKTFGAELVLEEQECREYYQAGMAK